MPHTLINPPGLHDPVGFGYSHVARVSGELVLIAGQYASDDTGQVTSPDFTAQVRRSFQNLLTALRAAGLDHTHVVQLRTFIVDHDADKLAALLTVIREVWGDRPPTQTLVGVASLAFPEMLFEVDALAVVP